MPTGRGCFFCSDVSHNLYRIHENGSVDRYFEYIPKEDVHNYIEYEKDDEQEENIYSNQLVSKEEKKFSFLEFLIKIFKRKHVKTVKKLVEPIIEPVLEPRIQILNNK